MRVHLSLCIFSFVALVALIFSCVKEDVSQESLAEEALRGKSPLLQLDIATTPVLPVDMSQWYTSPGTKASGVEDNLCFASLSQLRSYLLPDKALRNSFEEGYYYLETPLNLGSGCLKGAFSQDGTAVNDTLVGIKSFYVVRDNVFDNSHKEFLVTMIPSYSYLQENREYSYLFKRNFSGVAIYADTLGSFQKIVLFDRGRASQTAVNSMPMDSSGRCCFYKYLPYQTKSGGGDTLPLNGVWVIADRPASPDYTLLFTINVQERDCVGGENNADYWGDFGGGRDGRQDKPFKYEEDNAVKSYTVTLNAMGMLTGSTSFTVTDSVSTVTIDAGCFGTPPSDGFFGWWMDGRGCKVSDEITFSATITSDTTFTACYLYNNPLCQALASTVKNAVLGENVGEFLALVGKGAKVEHSYLGRVNGTSVTNDHFTQNERGKVNSQLNLNSKYMYYIHNHPSNIPLPSGKDLLSLYYCIKNGLDYNTELFRYIITSDNLIAYLYVVDRIKLLDYFANPLNKPNEWIDIYNNEIETYNTIDHTAKGVIDYLNRYYFDLMGIRLIFQLYENDLNDCEWQTKYGESERENCLRSR